MTKEAFQRAVDNVGGQTALADRLGVRQSHVWHWLHKSAKGVPAEYCAAVERVSGVPKHELRPDIYSAPDADVQTAAESVAS